MPDQFKRSGGSIQTARYLGGVVVLMYLPLFTLMEQVP
jgi:type II secretory pathway component PulF